MNAVVSMVEEDELLDELEDEDVDVDEVLLATVVMSGSI
jgi:hypothetical protein